MTTTTEANLRHWQYVSYVLLSIRFVQGWIFWGGGSRRFFYAPAKLDPYAPEWMANKLQSAMPGALLGTQDIINYLLLHFDLLYFSLIAFSLVELCVGIALLTGFMTRLAGLISIFLSISLMLIFGWQGSTCMDGWTIAASNCAMGFALALGGSHVLSIDNWILTQFPKVQTHRLFVLFGSGTYGYHQVKKLSTGCLILTILFSLVSYSYYRGAIISAYHGGPVDPLVHHLKLSEGLYNAKGNIQFRAYVDSGTPAVPSHIIRIELIQDKNNLIKTWVGSELNHLPSNAIKNTYDYNEFRVAFYGLSAFVGSKATILLETHQPLNGIGYTVKVYTMNGLVFSLPLKAN